MNTQERYETDRRVHAVTPLLGVEVVRYDRSGKWWIELGDDRQRVTIDEAVAYVHLTDAEVRFGVRGGAAFDRRVRAASGLSGGPVVSVYQSSEPEEHRMNTKSAITDDDRLVLIGGLRRLRRQHRYVEDCWYSCPKATDGCCNDAEGDDCNCGADTHNALVDSLLNLLGAASGLSGEET